MISSDVQWYGAMVSTVVIDLWLCLLLTPDSERLDYLMAASNASASVL